MTSALPPASLEGAGRLRARWWWLAFAVLLLGATAWWATHPAALPRGGRVEAQVPTGVPVHLGVLDPGDRELTLRTVRWDEAGVGSGDEVEAVVCRGGSVSATRDLAPFCDEVVTAEGAVLGPGDQLVLTVTAAEPGRTSYAGVLVSFREGLQRGEQRAGRDLEVVATER